jgi:hypothetical protein
MSNAKPYNPQLQKVKYKLKGIMLFISPFPVFIASIIDLVGGHITGSLINAAAFAGFMLSAIIARHGFKMEGEYHRRAISRAPRTPFKTIAAIFLSITVGLTAWLSVHYELLESLLFSAATFLGFALFYGLDPRKDKTGNLSFGVTADEVIEALEAAEIRIDGIEKARKSIRNIEISNRLQRITNKAREVIATIEQNPDDLDRSRRFLKTYLDGAKRVTESYVKTEQGQTHITYNTDFGNVLDSIEKTIDQQQIKLQKNDQFDLDVQIKVLETQLIQEGISSSPQKP